MKQISKFLIVNLFILNFNLFSQSVLYFSTNDSESQNNSKNYECSNDYWSNHYQQTNDFQQRIADAICDREREIQITSFSNQHYEPQTQYKSANIFQIFDNQLIENYKKNHIIVDVKDRGSFAIPYKVFSKISNEHLNSCNKKTKNEWLQFYGITDLNQKNQLLLLSKLNLYQFSNYRELIKTFPEYDDFILALSTTLRTDARFLHMTRQMQGWEDSYLSKWKFREFVHQEARQAVSRKTLSNTTMHLPKSNKLIENVKNNLVPVAATRTPPPDLNDLVKIFEGEIQPNNQLIKYLINNFDQIHQNPKMFSLMQNQVANLSQETNITYNPYEIEFFKNEKIQANVLVNEKIQDEAAGKLILKDYSINLDEITLLYQNNKSIIQITGKKSFLDKILSFFLSSTKSEEITQDILQSEFTRFQLVASIILDFLPIVGDCKGICEAISGKDIVTGEKLSNLCRCFSALSFVPGVKYCKKGLRFLKTSKEAKILLLDTKISRIASKQFLKREAEKVVEKAPQITIDVYKTIEKLVKPNGKLIGEEGTKITIREIKGTEKNARAFFEKLVEECGGKHLIKAHDKSQNGLIARFPCGRTIGYRPISNSGHPSIDFGGDKALINLIKKIKFT